MGKDDFTYLVNCITSELIPLIMQDFGCARDVALDKLYHTSTYSKLLNPRTGLYYQSTLYVYELLLEELEKREIFNKVKGSWKCDGLTADEEIAELRKARTQGVTRKIEEL